MATERSGSTRRLVGAIPLLAGAAVTGLAAEVVWVARRPLPSFEGFDVSGVVGGRLSGPPIRVVVLGDSTSTGPGLAGPEQVWLRRALVRMDLDRSVQVFSLAVGGSRVADVATRLDEAIELRADLAVVAVGSNDAIHCTSRRNFTAELERVVSRLDGCTPVVAVCNVGDLGNLARVPPPIRRVLRHRSATIRHGIEEVVARHDRLVLLDVTAADSLFRDRSIYAPDLFHPNQAGHEAWAAAVEPGLRKAFAQLDGARASA